MLIFVARLTGSRQLSHGQGERQGRGDRRDPALLRGGTSATTSTRRQQAGGHHGGTARLLLATRTSQEAGGHRGMYFFHQEKTHKESSGNHVAQALSYHRCTDGNCARDELTKVWWLGSDLRPTTPAGVSRAGTQAGSSQCSGLTHTGAEGALCQGTAPRCHQSGSKLKGGSTQQKNAPQGFSPCLEMEQDEIAARRLCQNCYFFILREISKGRFIFQLPCESSSLPLQGR